MNRGMLAFAIVVTLGSSAHADWDFVKWGMSKNAAIGASKGEAKFASGSNVVCALDSQKPFATIPKKSIDGFDFRVTLCTDGSDKVTSVALSPIDRSVLPELRHALILQYGQPTKQEGADTWNDRRGNMISYYEAGATGGRIEYKKLQRPGLDVARADSLGFRNMLQTR